MFQECKNLEEKKKLYRRLSKYLHPDCGGEGDLMALLTRSYEIATKSSSFQNFSPDIEDAEEEEEREWDGIPAHVNRRVFKNYNKTILIDIILLYAKEHASFKTDFVMSIKKYLQSHGSISAKQYNCLVDLYYSRNIDHWFQKQKNKQKS